MAELANCSRCDAVFVKGMRDICQNCFKEEEAAFDTVYRFLRERKNREATLQEVVEATGVEQMLILKFVKQKRLRTSQFPKLAYPCTKCGEPIVQGELCEKCVKELKDDLKRFEKTRSVEQKDESNEPSRTYYLFDKS
ncbi:TIGR03826 family flagellar region protein [Oceanobacillus manasiensis]|uniref:TIGR03826 family flagellar region protein n=1 Tax=Oceanobacillus manasiensis TaxID=586413 RepID=UPI0005AB7D25|nr:TIGR03826 family flagellar region protein [Oceanobacillus manasiensis]